MILKECYKVLGLPEDALLVDLKSAYRRLAFALHPDLNPDVPDAASRFQELNEAYVTLSQALAAAESGARKPPESSSRVREEARKAYEKGEGCLLDAQIRTPDGRLTGWAQQYNEHTLKPAQARKFEYPGTSGEDT
ncbi:MAG: DnaJ domain-containing protein, partial [Deltaproteobacteria bacterium]|nr:DnaJ domain-containing protein [Deltaproteobacteria bacterium]